MKHFLALLLVCGVSARRVDDVVGVWNGSLPSAVSKQLSGNPLMGNGYLGVVMGQSGPSTEWWVNTNANWRCEAGGSVAKGRCQMAALGKVTMQVFGRSGPHRTEQRLGSATVHTFSPTVNTTTFLHPLENLVFTNVSWSGAEGDVVEILSTTPLSSSDLWKSYWSAVGVESGDDGLHHFVRQPTNATGVRAVRTAVATRVVPSSGISIGTPRTLETGTFHGGGVNVTLTQSSGSFVVVTAVDDRNDVTGAIALAREANSLEAKGEWQKRWDRYWSVSTVTLPEDRAIEEFWYGAQYVTGCMTPSVEILDKFPDAPPSGLYGPWVTTDVPSWHGDYTLDYNQEAQYYAVSSSNRPDLLKGYFPPIVDWIPAARLEAQQQAKKGKIACPPTALHFACHLAPWGYQSTDTNVYMHWNGMFAALLFLHHYEFTLDADTAREVTLPLLEGLADWITCYLTKEFGVYNDANLFNPDEEHEGQRVRNPQIGLALIRRTLEGLVEVTKGVGKDPSPAVLDVLAHLAPFNSNGVVWTSFQLATELRSDLFATYPVWPSEVYDSSAPEDVVKIARSSALRYSDFTHGRPVEVYPNAVRSGVTGIRDKLPKYLANYQRPNLLPSAPGGGTENVGVAVAVNDMLVQRVGGIAGEIVLFPLWDGPASFSSLRVKGAVVISATRFANGTLTGVTLSSSYPQKVSVRGTWGAVRCGAVVANATRSPTATTFPLPANVTCHLS